MCDTGRRKNLQSVEAPDGGASTCHISNVGDIRDATELLTQVPVLGGEALVLLHQAVQRLHRLVQIRRARSASGGTRTGGGATTPRRSALRAGLRSRGGATTRRCGCGSGCGSCGRASGGRCCFLLERRLVLAALRTAALRGSGVRVGGATAVVIRAHRGDLLEAHLLAHFFHDLLTGHPRSLLEQLIDAVVDLVPEKFLVGHVHLPHSMVPRSPRWRSPKAIAGCISHGCHRIHPKMVRK